MSHRFRFVRTLVVLAVTGGLCLVAPTSPAAQVDIPSSPNDPAATSLAVTREAVAEFGVEGASVRVACAVVRRPSPCGLVSSSREALGGRLAEYTYVIRVGPGRHDRIAVHRVVNEVHAGRPAHTTTSTFFVHGDLWGFDAAFAGALGEQQRDPNVATYLARRGVDVWGIDQRWVLVPATVTDPTFMHDWGFATQLGDMRLAMTFQRVLRLATGEGLGQTALVGWSRGGQLAYAYAGLETQLPGWARNVKALVPAEGMIHYAPRDRVFSDALCESYASGKRRLESGESANAFAGLAQYGSLALTDPDSPAPDYPPYTNRVLALDVGTYPDNNVFNAWYHFVAGRLLADRTPTGLRYTAEARWFRLLTKVAPYESLATFVDGAALFCGRIQSPFDDHLAEVRVPVLELGAAGGFGTKADYSTTLVGSQHVTRLIVRLQRAGHEATDFGHVDLWHARNAPALAWTPLLDWLRNH